MQVGETKTRGSSIGKKKNFSITIRLRRARGQIISKRRKECLGSDGLFTARRDEEIVPRKVQNTYTEGKEKYGSPTGISKYFHGILGWGLKDKRTESSLYHDARPYFREGER